MVCAGQRLNAGFWVPFVVPVVIKTSTQGCLMHWTPLKTHTFLEEAPGEQVEYPWALEMSLGEEVQAT